ncbi:MAG: nitrilase-related carbon-nitrogen hydrolase, partial [Stackebrandtia sp.]
MRSVRIGLAQASWTGDQESMLAKHEALVRQAADQGVQAICFQELFHGPYFGIVQDPKYYEYAQQVPGPITQRFAGLARKHRMVMVLPVYEEDIPGVLYNTAAVLDADGTYLGKYRKNHLPHLDRFWEKFYFRPGNLGWPVFDTAVGRIGVA